MAHIESHIESPISIQELASIAGLSPSHFCRAFRRSLKESPHCFVVQRRIARSQALTSTTRAPRSHIAIDCGFADQAHFSSSPREYRSRFLPRFLGVWLALAGAGWVILSLVSLLLPGCQDKVYMYTQPAVIGEIVFMFWLLIMGAKPPVSAAEASAGA